MFRAQLQSPRMAAWQFRLARMPRWSWPTIGVAAVLLVLSVAVFAAIAGVITLALAAGYLAVRNVYRRLAGGRTTQLAQRDPFTSRDVIVVERVDNKV
jgi:hypothetical protein